MKYFTKALFVLLVLIIGITALLPLISVNHGHEQEMSEWEITWVDQLDLSLTADELSQLPGWKQANAGDPTPQAPAAESRAAWVRLLLPAGNENSAIMLEQLSGKQVIVLEHEHAIYNKTLQRFPYTSDILLPVKLGNEPTELYIGMASDRGKVGLYNPAKYGEFTSTLFDFVRKDMTDLILGCSFTVIAVMLLVCSLFVIEEGNKAILSLAAVILCIGILVITYSPFLYNFYSSYGTFYRNLFDLALFAVLPIFSYFMEQIFNKGRFLFLLRRFRQFQTVYSLICLVFLLLHGQQQEGMYNFVTGTVLGYLMMIQIVLLIICTISSISKGNREEGLIFTAGLISFGGVGLGELFWYYLSGSEYRLHLWKWGVLCFVLSLIVIVGRRISKSHDQVLEYSRKLEAFNNELQRSEKMEIISELAASVAHEVRNPLQVTRGFLQLLSNLDHSPQEKQYLGLALEELDRASGIISDFLTFAKPEVNKPKKLNIAAEFKHIESILSPMANLNSGKITVTIPESLFIMGSSSKFKQAFINIIKNSIESFKGNAEGEIRLWAYELEQTVYIHVKDNGEGMTEAELQRLGEPYFSNKTKGTGLGLMVTFRIIEVMQGDIRFVSEKGKGTEVIITLPAVAG